MYTLHHVLSHIHSSYPHQRFFSKQMTLMTVDYPFPFTTSKVHKAVQQQGQALEFASDFWNDPMLVTAAVKNDPAAFQWASKELQSDRELWLQAWKVPEIGPARPSKGLEQEPIRTKTALNPVQFHSKLTETHFNIHLTIL